MDITQLKILAKQGESHTLEFKKSTSLLHAAFETICAFLNSDGGTVIIGVNNKGQILGQDVTDNTRQEIAHEISKLEPPIQVKVHYVLADTHKTAIVVNVETGIHAPYTYDGRSFQRVQSATKKMPQQRYDQLVAKRSQLNYSWERFISNYDISIINEDTLRTFIKNATIKARLSDVALKEPIDTILKKLNLLVNGKLTNAAVVLFGKDFFSDYPQCQLKLARFKGTTRKEFIDSDMVYGNAFELINRGMSFAEKHLPVAAKIIPGKQQRIETPLIPYVAIREALNNAICHRDYSRLGGSIGLAIYDDRLEIFNSGGLPSGITLDMIKKGHSELRNPLIAKVFYIVGYIETWGRGIPDIIDSCKVSGDPEPEFVIHDDISFAVQFKFPTPLRKVMLTGFSEKDLIEATNISIELARKLTKRQQEILIILMSSETLTIKQLIGKLNNPPTERMVRIDLNQLKKLGLINSSGKTRNTLWFAENRKT